MNKWVKILLLGSYLWYFGEGLLGPLYTVFAERIGGDILQLTGAYALYLIVFGVCSIIVGRYSDHHSKRNIMLVGYAMNAIFTFSYLLVDSPLKLFIAQCGLGVAAALATPTWDYLFSVHLDKKGGGGEWGLSDGGPRVIMGISVLVGGFILTYFGFEALFIIMGCIQVVATIVQYQIIRIGHQKHDVPPRLKPQGRKSLMAVKD